MKILTSDATKGVVEAQRYMGHLYDTGEGVPQTHKLGHHRPLQCEEAGAADPAGAV